MEIEVSPRQIGETSALIAADLAVKFPPVQLSVMISLPIRIQIGAGSKSSRGILNLARCLVPGSNYSILTRNADVNQMYRAGDYPLCRKLGAMPKSASQIILPGTEMAFQDCPCWTTTTFRTSKSSPRALRSLAELLQRLCHQRIQLYLDLRCSFFQESSSVHCIFRVPCYPDPRGAS